jgi:hypothetical protein
MMWTSGIARYFLSLRNPSESQHMDEQQWLESRDPANMVRFLLNAEGREKPHRVITGRKLRLLIVALWRRMTWPWGGTASEEGAIRRAERGADGDEGVEWSGTGSDPGSIAVAYLACCPRPAEGVMQVFAHLPVFLDETSKQANIVREVMGNPFRPIQVPRTWLTWNNGTVWQLAEAIYHGRDWESLPLLADALEEAGCTEPDLLAHLRERGPHVRGCWALDLLLGRQ